VGGTVLTYEIDPESSGDPTDPGAMVDALNRRFETVGADHVYASVSGDRRSVDIYVTNQGDHEADVAAVKELIRRAGRLELRVVANERDEATALEAAGKYLAAARTDPALAVELEAR